MYVSFLNISFLNSNWTLFHAEVLNLRNIFTRNGYTRELFDQMLQAFMVKCTAGSNSCDNGTAELSTKAEQYTLVLPYFGLVSDKFRLRFRRFCKKYSIDCRIAFRPYKVSQYFSLKSPVPEFLQSSLVYKYVCSIESKHTYIGKTKRHLSTRIKEHGSTDTAIRAHCDNCTCFSHANFSIIRTCNTDFEATLAEALYIRNFKPTLNNTIANSGSSTLLKL